MTSLRPIIEQAFIKATQEVLVLALQGLDAASLRDPERCTVLKDTAEQLPAHIPRVLEAKEMLLQLCTISQQLQLAYKEYEDDSRQKN
jgi:hypothetical protein